MAELADALDLGSGGQPWGFKSLYAHHILNLHLAQQGFFVFYRGSMAIYISLIEAAALRCKVYTAENLKMDVCLYNCPGSSTVLGKFA